MWHVVCDPSGPVLRRVGEHPATALRQLTTPVRTSAQEGPYGADVVSSRTFLIEGTLVEGIRRHVMHIVPSTADDSTQEWAISAPGKAVVARQAPSTCRWQ